MFKTLQELRKKLVIGFVGGSDLAKIAEQLDTGVGNCKQRSLCKDNGRE